MGLITFGAGLAVSTRLPGAVVAFILGTVLAIAGRSGSILELGLAHTDRPVRLVLLVLVGAHLGFHPVAIALGVTGASSRPPASSRSPWPSRASR